MGAAEAGDEPVLLALRNPACPVLIGRKRRDVVRYIEETGCADLIILDDAFQHRAVARDVDLVLIDGARPLGNGWPLPAGNLREFPAALARADLLLRTRAGAGQPARYYGRPTFNSHHQLADVAVSLHGEQIPLRALQGLKLAAFAGIADPDGFFCALEHRGLRLTEKITLPDHVIYSAQQIDGLQAVAERIDAYITTEKDAVKLAPDLFRRPCYQVPLVLDIDKEDELFAAIGSKLWRTS
jgi:tetraacyldisaccharide 4'-kinase